MRVPRTILIGLSPLLSLWALGAQLASEPAGRVRVQATEQLLAADSLQRFIEPMVSFLLLAAGQASATAPAVHHPPQAVLALDALRSTLFRHAIWLVRAEPAADLHSRRNRTTPLRC